MAAEPFNMASLTRIAADNARKTLAANADLFALAEVPGERKAELVGLASVWGLQLSHGECATSFRDRFYGLLRAVEEEEASDPTPAERAAIEEAVGRTAARKVPPAVKVKRDWRRQAQLGSPHSDVDGWLRQLCDALATRSLPVLQTFVSSLRALQPDHRDPDAVKLNAAIAIVSDAKPKTTAEAMLVAQLVSLNWLYTDAAARYLNMANPTYGSLAARLAKAFNDTMAQLHRQQGKTNKFTLKVRTERHDHRYVHYHTGGGAADFGGQSRGSRRDEPACASEVLPPAEPPRRPALPCPDPERDALPAAGKPWPQALPAPRRQRGSAEG